MNEEEMHNSNIDNSIGFEILLCGERISNFEHGIIFDNLSRKIAKVTSSILSYDWSKEIVELDIPFYARNVLESCMIAILGRIDPFRLIQVYKVQSDSSYDLGKRVASSIEWQGDIISKETPQDTLWRCDRKKESFDRALLGAYFAEVYWKPAYRHLSDYYPRIDNDSIWLAEMFTSDEDSMYARIRSMALSLYSSLSKGVHSECLIDTDIFMDSVTIKAFLKDTYKLCSWCGLISHFIDLAAMNIDKNRAIQIFRNVERAFENV